MIELWRKWKCVCAAHKSCSDCPVSLAVGDANICYILGQGFEDSEIEALVRVLREEHDKLEEK